MLERKCVPAFSYFFINVYSFKPGLLVRILNLCVWVEEPAGLNQNNQGRTDITKATGIFLGPQARSKGTAMREEYG